MDGNNGDLKYTAPNRHRMLFEQLQFRRYTAGALKPHHNHPVSAIDTETYHGEAKLISDSFGNYLLDGDIDQILSFLTHARFRSNHIFAFNLQYDAEAVLKMLPEINIQDIYETNETNYSDYRIRYIPKKLLTVRDRHEHTSRFFDIAQFYEMSLDNALKKYLNLEKTEYPHRAELNTNPDIWESDIDAIIAYNLDDSRKTGLLAEFLQNNIKELFHFNPRSYVSKASLTKDLVRQVGYVPEVRKVPKGALKCAFYSYKGGRFEVLQRGHFPDTELYDINSAYSSIIRTLPDVTLGEWVKVRDFNPEYEIGFYLCNVYVLPAFICPITYLLKGVLTTFPAGHFKTYLTFDEIVAYEKYALIEVVYGWEFRPSEIELPFMKYIDDLFIQKQQYQKTDYQYDLVKKMMNSLYGCFYEKHVEEKRITPGILFNPVYASVITAKCRIMLFQKAVKHSDHVIALQTDSILFDKKVHIPTSKKLGAWDLEATGDAVVLQSGIYQIAGKLRSRGMQRANKVNFNDTLYENIFEAIHANPAPTKYLISQERPLHLRECMMHTKTLSHDDINVWTKVNKTIDVNADIKRQWTDKFKHGADIFTTAHRSKPWYIDDGK